MSRKPVTLDVREDIRSGREPFSRIMQAVATLAADQDLRLIAPFEPTPLYAMLGAQGFNHAATATPAGDFEVVFSRAQALGTSAGPEPLTRGGQQAVSSASVVEVDARGLEPPQPLVTILEALTTLPAGASLRAHTDRRPMHLFSHLEERGFSGEATEQGDGSFVTLIRRREAVA